MIVLDASVLIAHLDSTDPHHARATQLLLDYAASEFTASTVTHAELLVRPTQLSCEDQVIRELAAIGVGELPLELGSGARLARLRVETRLKLPDCCVLLAAQDCAAERVLTFDDKLRTAAQKLGFPAG